jgi:beta-glucanase (GH16 family)
MKFFKVLIFAWFLLGLSKIKAQLPLGDATFSLTHTDNFNNSTLSPQWGSGLPWGPGGGGAYFSNTNVILTYSSGYLALKTATTTPITYTPSPFSPYYYTGGTISSTFTCKYGYYEISAKNPIGLGYGCAFWLFGGATSTACPAALGGGWHDYVWC